MGWGGRWEGVSGWGTGTPWLIHVNVWQKPLQYCKVTSLQLNKLKRESSPTLQVKSFNSLALSLLYGPTLTSIHTGKTITLARWTFVGKLMSLLFNTVQVCHQRRQWHPTPVLLPGKSYGRRSLVDCSPWGREELDTTEAT